MFISEFARLSGWDQRFASGSSSRLLLVNELCSISLQFFSKKWIYGPVVYWRGKCNVVNYPIIATDSKLTKGVVIHDNEELTRYAEEWRKDDFSNLNCEIIKEEFPNTEKLATREFNMKLRAAIEVNPNVVTGDIYFNGFGGYDDDLPSKFILWRIIPK